MNNLNHADNHPDKVLLAFQTIGLRSEKLDQIALLCNFLAAFLALFSQRNPIINGLTIGSALLALIFLFFSFRLKKEEKRLLKAHDAQIAKTINLQHLLNSLATNSLKFRDSWRLTLYRFENNKWVIISRVSSSPIYQENNEYETLEKSQSILRGPLRHARSTDSNNIDVSGTLADPSNLETLPAWKEGLEELGLIPSTYNNMPTRNFAGAVFQTGQDSSQNDDEVLGLIIETTSDKEISRIKIENTITRPLFESMHEILKIQKKLNESDE